MKQLLTFVLLFVLSFCYAQQLAFPSAEGFGKYTSGGRDGEVYHVTNLNDNGAGSFRDAVSQPYRIVVFDVGGVINISSRIVIKHHVYVAGQTAPGGGITIYGNGIAFNGDSGDDIIRYIRIRMGRNGDSGKDAVAISENQNYIFDHVSISWGRDGTLDVNGSGIDNLTFQDCIIGQGINNSNHSTGGLMQSGKWSMIRSLYIDNKTRNPKARGTHEFINSVLYNWASNGYIMGDTEGLSECNMIGNYFIYGPSSSSGSHFTRSTPSFNVYGEDNWVDPNKNGVLDGYQISDYKTATLINTPYNYPGVNNKLSAVDALNHVLNHVGASLTRDAVDNYLIDEVLSYGTKGQIINTEDDNGINGNVGTVENGTPPTDSDQDGMPDQWESERGLNPNLADDKGDDDQDGYTNIEEYLSCLVGEGDACTFNPKLDCNGDVNGTAYLDDCNTCVGGNTGKTACYIDCNGDIDGTANIDECGRCTGGNTGINACLSALQGGDFCEAAGIIENKNDGFAGNGYLNLDNATGTSATWYLFADEEISTSIGIRYANGSTSSRGVSVVINGTSQATLTGAPTGAWTSWTEEYPTLTLNKGSNKIELISKTTDGAPNIDLFIINDSKIHLGNCSIDCQGVMGGTAFIDSCGFCVEGTTGNSACIKDCAGEWGGDKTTDNCGVCLVDNTIQPCTGSLEAETACSLDGTVDNNNDGFSGDGFINTTNVIDAATSWIIESPSQQDVTISFRFANGGTSARDAVLLLNEATVGPLLLPPTGSWETWGISTINITLNQGLNEIKLVASTADGLANIDILYLSNDVTDGDCGLITAINQDHTNGIACYPNPTTNTLHLSQNVEWELVTPTGTLMQKGHEKLIDLSNFENGVYMLKVADQVVKVIKH